MYSAIIEVLSVFFLVCDLSAVDSWLALAYQETVSRRTLWVWTHKTFSMPVDYIKKELFINKTLTRHEAVIFLKYWSVCSEYGVKIQYIGHMNLW